MAEAVSGKSRRGSIKERIIVVIAAAAAKTAAGYRCAAAHTGICRCPPMQG